MDTIVLKYIIYIIMLYLLLPLAVSICDEYEGGIDYQQWTMEPSRSWSVDDTDHNAGNNSIKSELNCRQTSSISTLRIGGPRTVYWSWKLTNNGQSNSSLELLDNGKPTGFLISEKDNGNWHNYSYDIKDASSHELKFIHKTNWGISTARIDGMCITPPIIVFKNAEVEPGEEITASISVDSQKFYKPPNSTYKVEVETQIPSLNIKLFTVLPNNKTVSYVAKTVDRENRTAIWDNIKLCNNELGSGKYWFEAIFDPNKIGPKELDQLAIRPDHRVRDTLNNSIIAPIKSNISIGPYISHVLLQANFTGNKTNRTFCIVIKGRATTDIGLIASDDEVTWKLANGTNLNAYTSLGKQQRLCFVLPRNDPSRNFHEFAINGVRN